MKIVVVGDIIVSCDSLEEAVAKLNTKEKFTVKKIHWHSNDKEDFQKKALNIEMNGATAEEPPIELYEEIVNADILLVHFCPLPSDLLTLGKNLKLIGTCRGGLEHIDVDMATKMGIPVIHVIRNAEAVSDFTLGLILAETRNIARAHLALKSGDWRKEYINSAYTTTLKDMVLGIVGLGHIGQLVAQKCAAIGMKVISYDPYVTQEMADERGIPVTMMTKDEVFSTSDVISLHLRVTPETENSINEDLIRLMKPTAYLINTSRAKVLDKKSLINALENKTIGGAALDVFWDEPVQIDDPILKLDNLTITPHIAGNVVDALEKSPKLLVEEINNFWDVGKSDMVVNLKELKNYRIDKK